eukprot:CAMPEP_0119302334 /NCGR_PEP_ID=MMETSP1333-20130426/3946_1 /TAXON_ID=418940 /ORGANISM="Scyphosphaera apsteinii, Strain RCC1455" /LENGTH=259 /DNA_ID=CAMNT_0007304657 /DNA_START=225 /DNA_END=1004 /DNA_ORIENTATION=-
MIKTRHQLNRGVNPSLAASLSILYQEGGVRRFYRGVIPEFAGMVPKSSAMYASYEWARRGLQRHTSLDEVSTCFLAGIASGPAEAAVVQPFQVVKVRMQTKEYVGRYVGSFDCAMQILRSEGVAAFARSGAGATVWRNTVWNSIYFSAMAQVRTGRSSEGSATYNKLLELASGFMCGVLATAFNAPFDVAKSLQQSQLPDATQPYGGTAATLVRVVREEGVSACWAGFQAKAIRMGLAGLVGLSSFDAVQWLLKGAKAA